MAKVGREGDGTEGEGKGGNEGGEAGREVLHAKFHLNVFMVSVSGG